MIDTSFIFNGSICMARGPDGSTTPCVWHNGQLLLLALYDDETRQKGLNAIKMNIEAFLKVYKEIAKDDEIDEDFIESIERQIFGEDNDHSD